MRTRTLASVWRICSAGFILVGLLACPALADKAITKVNVKNDTERVIINVQGDHALHMSVLASARGHYLGFQFPCKLVDKGRRVGVRSGGIRNVRYGNFTSNSTRIVANTSRHMYYSTCWSDDRHSVEISVWKPGSKTILAQKKAADLVVKVAGSLQVATSPAAIVPSFAGMPQICASAAVPVLRTDSTRIARITPAASEPQEEVSMKPGKKVSLNFLGADINDVLKALSVQSGENIVSSKDVTGSVTVSLSDVSIEEALDYVAKLSGYGYAKDKETFLVGSKDSLRSLIGGVASSNKTEVVALNYADAKDVLALLKAQLPELKTGNNAPAEGKQSDLIVLSGSEGIVNEARQLIAQVEDSLRARAEEEQMQVYEVKYVSPFELKKTLEALVADVKIIIAPSNGFDLIAPEAVQVGSGGDAAGGATVTHSEIKKSADEIGRVQALVFHGSESALTRALQLASQLDKKPPQVKIEAKITSLDEGGEKKLGLSWQWGQFAWLESFTGGDTNQVGSTESTTTSLARGNNAYARQPWNFSAALDALIKNGNGKLLASPTMMCIEGQPSVFFVGDEIHYIVMVQVTATGTNVTTDIANVGVQLRVNADVSPDGYITLNLHPEVSTVKLTKDQDTNVTLPVISRRFTDHVVRVKDGETIVIGGLIRDDEVDEMSKVPILGDLPILGHLFRHRAKTTAHTEVVMFLKVSLVND